MSAIEPYAGMEVYTDNDERVGRVKQPHWDGDPQASDYLTIDRPHARDFVVPRSILRVSDDHLALPFGMDLVDGAPPLGLHGGPMSSEERSVIDSCYSLWTERTGEPGREGEQSPSRRERRGGEMSEKAKQARDQAKAAADQIVEKAKAKGAELIERSKAKESELRAKADKQARELRAQAKKEAAELLEKAKAEAADVRAKAKQQAKEHLPKVKSKVS